MFGIFFLFFSFLFPACFTYLLTNCLVLLLFVWGKLFWMRFSNKNSIMEKVGVTIWVGDGSSLLLSLCNKQLISAIWCSSYLKKKRCEIKWGTAHFFLQAIESFSLRHLRAVNKALTVDSLSLYSSISLFPLLSLSILKSHSGILSNQWSMLVISPRECFNIWYSVLVNHIWLHCNSPRCLCTFQNPNLFQWSLARIWTRG